MATNAGTASNMTPTHHPENFRGRPRDPDKVLDGKSPGGGGGSKCWPVSGPEFCPPPPPGPFCRPRLWSPGVASKILLLGVILAARRRPDPQPLLKGQYYSLPSSLEYEKYKLFFCVLDRVSGQTWPRDPFQRAWLQKWCRTHSHLAPDTISKAIRDHVLVRTHNKIIKNMSLSEGPLQPYEGM
jgi:hypothetical protein